MGSPLRIDSETRKTNHKMKTTRVTLNDGTRSTLRTDDTLTLAFTGMTETTPASLRAFVCEKSLNRIASTSTDSNEVSKAEKALALRLQLSSHGAGRKSAQVFGDGLIFDANL
jgi:hypothetical protein